MGTLVLAKPISTQKKDLRKTAHPRMEHITDLLSCYALFMRSVYDNVCALFIFLFAQSFNWSDSYGQQRYGEK